ncbi:alpha/beta hydrolase [Lacinutrix jangbogonensis]|uniref:alpha/beta hydrolase n=1 Tax=Lacinutrix jangbogonensis TaxID=1469557 RepID=UPI00068D02F4|nr:alpha/beta fold hydrolase [Lacinutrix jangbogonensis]
MAKKHRIKIIKRFLFIFLILGLLLTHFFIPRLISEIRNPIVGLIKRNRNVSHKLITNEDSEIKRKTIVIKSFDNIKLSASLTYSDVDPIKGTVILLHGIRSNKDHFKGLSSLLSKNGYNSVALDLRAHGESEGQFCSFGVNEKKDVTKLIDYLYEKEDLNYIGIWGQSLGGAISLQAMGFDARLKFGIVESAFSDFKTIVNDYFHRYAGFSFAPFSNYLVNRTGNIAAFNPNEAKPIKYCENITQPVLIVHGNDDKRINIKYGKDNFFKIKSTDKEFLVVDTANHTNVWNVGGEKYFNKVISFLDKHAAANSSLSLVKK